MKRSTFAFTADDGQMEEVAVEEGAGSVFANLGFPDPDEHLQKVHLLRRIDTLLRERRLNQAQAAELLGIDQPGLSRLLRGAVRGFSLEKLMQFLTRLDQHVLIVVAPKEAQSAVVRVDVASDTADSQALVVRVARTPVPGRRTRGSSRDRLMPPAEAPRV